MPDSIVKGLGSLWHSTHIFVFNPSPRWTVGPGNRVWGHSTLATMGKLWEQNTYLKITKYRFRLLSLKTGVVSKNNEVYEIVEKVFLKRTNQYMHRVMRPLLLLLFFLLFDKARRLLQQVGHGHCFVPVGLPSLQNLPSETTQKYHRFNFYSDCAARIGSVNNVWLLLVVFAVTFTHTFVLPKASILVSHQTVGKFFAVSFFSSDSAELTDFTI